MPDDPPISMHEYSQGVLSDPTKQPSIHEISYRLYKRRFVGILGLVLMNIVSALSWPWFGPIANNMVTEFGFTLDQVTWLGNIVIVVYMPVALMMPTVVAKYGIRRCCLIGVPSLLLSAWVRYAGTARSLSVNASYALLMLGQVISAVAQPIFQVIGPIYSETWFDLKGRTTATMVISIANPFGGALGQLLSPIVGDTRKSILVLGIISTAMVPCVLLIPDAPPTPPTYAGSKPSLPLSSLIRAMMGMPTSQDAFMTVQERIDFSIIIFVFSILYAGATTFTIVTAQIMQPYGYSATISGLLGACLLLSGIISAVITAPLFDRVFTHHLASVSRILAPAVAVTWLSFIWAVKPHNTGGLFAIMAIIGGGSITMLPVALELACELTRNANASSAVLWFGGSLFTVVFVLVSSALRAGPNANPPLNMHQALIFNGAFAMCAASGVFFLRGKQRRRQLDEEKVEQSLITSEVTFGPLHVNVGKPPVPIF